MKKLTRPVQKVNAPVLGLDIHKDLIAYSFFDRAGDEIECGEIASSESELATLLDRLAGVRKIHVAFEACGGIWWAFDYLVERLGRQRVHVGQPRKIRAIANSQEKNDANDAWWLGYLTHEGRLPEAFIPSGVLRELRVATRERRAAVQLRTRALLRLRGHLRQMGVRLPGTKVMGKRSWAFLQELTDSTPGMLGRALRNLLQLLEHVEASIREWAPQIEEMAGELPAFEVLKRHIPGLGVVLAATVAAEAGPIQRFRTAKAFARYTGLTPGERSTGGRTIHVGISRQGSPHLRWALTQAAMACLKGRQGNALAVGTWIRAKERRIGGKAKARVAGARKLSETIWRLFHYGELFDASRPFGGRCGGATA